MYKKRRKNYDKIVLIYSFIVLYYKQIIIINLLTKHELNKKIEISRITIHRFIYV